MSLMYSKNKILQARYLRKNMTKEELKLWLNFLKPLNAHMRRQKAIGNYVVDFYIASARLVIELDGSQHYIGNIQERDRSRDSFMENMGLKILRYSNDDINNNFSGVCEDIAKNIEERKRFPENRIINKL